MRQESYFGADTAMRITEDLPYLNYNIENYNPTVLYTVQYLG